jgi:hypothetical protein
VVKFIQRVQAETGLPVLTDISTLEEGLAAEAEIFGRLCGTADKAEGTAAFLAKRTAVWMGR